MSDKIYDNSGNQVGEIKHSGLSAGAWFALITLGFFAAHDMERHKLIEDHKAYARSRGLPEPTFDDEPSWFLSGLGIYVCGFLAIFGILFGLLVGDSSAILFLVVGILGLVGCILILARLARYHRQREESNRQARWGEWDLQNGVAATPNRSDMGETQRDPERQTIPRPVFARWFAEELVPKSLYAQERSSHRGDSLESYELCTCGHSRAHHLISPQHATGSSNDKGCTDLVRPDDPRAGRVVGTLVKCGCQQFGATHRFLEDREHRCICGHPRKHHADAGTFICTELPEYGDCDCTEFRAPPFMAGTDRPGGLPGLSYFTPSSPLDAGGPIVSKSGRDGTFDTISKALKTAPPGSLILIEPGEYKECLMIDKPLTIQGCGSGAEDVVLRCSAGAPAAISIHAHGCSIRGLSVQHPSYGPAVKVASSSRVQVPDPIAIEHCILSSVKGRSAIEVFANTLVQVRESTVLEGHLEVGSWTEASLERNQIYSGIRISGSARVRENIIVGRANVDNRSGSGIEVSGSNNEGDYTWVEIDKNDISGFHTGVDVTYDVRLAVDRNHIHRCHVGVSIDAQDVGLTEEAIVDGNTIEDTLFAGIKIAGGAGVRLVGNRVTHCEVEESVTVQGLGSYVRLDGNQCDGDVCAELAGQVLRLSEPPSTPTERRPRPPAFHKTPSWWVAGRLSPDSKRAATRPTRTYDGTVNDMVRDARPGEVIHVPPGEFSLDLSVAKPLEIIGAATGESVLHIVNSGPVKKSLSLRHVTLAHEVIQAIDDIPFMLEVRSGSIEIEECVVRCGAGFVKMDGASARVALKNNDIACSQVIDCRRAAYIAIENNRLNHTVPPDDLCDDHSVAISLRGTEMLVSRNKLHGFVIGVGLIKGTALIDSNEFKQCHMAVTVSGNQARATISNNKVTFDGTAIPAWESDERWWVEDGLNVTSGVEVTSKNGHAVIEANTFKNLRDGIRLNGGSATIEQNQIEECTTGVNVKQGDVAGTVQGNRISGCRVGVYVGAADVRVQGNEISGNACAVAIACEDVSVGGNHIQGNGVAFQPCEHNARLLLAANTVEGNDKDLAELTSRAARSHFTKGSSL